MFLSYLYFNPFKHFPKSVPKNERISPKTSFLLPKMVLGIFPKMAGTLDFPSNSCIFAFSQKRYFQKPLCRLTNPVSVFLTNSASLHTLSFQRRIDCRKRDSLTGFVTRFREGVWGRDFFKSIDFTRFFKIFVNRIRKKRP